MDLYLYGTDHAVPPEDLASIAGLTTEQVVRAYEMIQSKRKSARYLKSTAIMALADASLTSSARWFQ